MALSDDRLREIVLELGSRPHHEKVRTDVHILLVDGLGAASVDVHLERPVPEVRGRIDALLGRTVFEFKTDMRREQSDAEDQLARYLRDRESQTGERFVGIATDGAIFILYELRGDALRRMDEFTPAAEDPRGLLEWLSTVVAVSAELDPTPDAVRQELGRLSPAWQLARGELADLWATLRDRPDVALKRGLWGQLLERVYGSPVENDDLFLQHTYLTIVAKTMATHILVRDQPSPADLLSGRAFQEVGITGAVESDFFDWLLEDDGGGDLVRRIALQVARFKLREVQADVLKGLYESLIDPDQRHDLGEYYTPDWLAERICEHTIDRPLEQRVLDPACGSGAFLFHAVRRLLAAADREGMATAEALALVTDRVIGVDVHPVAAQIARVTYLLAIGENRLREHAHLAIPVYLGDSLQWDTQGFLVDREVLIEVPDGGPELHFPVAVAGNPSLFDEVIDRMLNLGRQDVSGVALSQWLAREHPEVRDSDIDIVLQTYERLRDLHREGRDHIWGFIARNLVRPVWLSQQDQRADVVLGNPPWLSYRFMAKETKQRFRDESRLRGLWVGGNVATHQDLSGYFFARCAELYLKPEGLIAFVMPYAALSRRQFEGFRKGVFGQRKRGKMHQLFGTVQFTEAWAFAEDVQPLFPVPACVLFARNEMRAVRGSDTIGWTAPLVRLPRTVNAASGTLPRRDATAREAQRALKWSEVPWPEAGAQGVRASPYRDIFRQGATMVPRMLCVVDEVSAGTLGTNPDAPLVESHRTGREKPPWKGLGSLRGAVEAEFLRPLYLGESVAPFQLLTPVLSLVPWSEQSQRLLDSDDASEEGYAHLARWLKEAESCWQENGTGSMSLLHRWNYHNGLITQLPPNRLRVVYAASGTLPAAALIKDDRAVTEHKLYWAPVASLEEGRYLLAILNSEAARSRVEHLQSRGQWGARDFDKVVLSLPIPLYDVSDDQHRRLSETAARAEEIAAAVDLEEGTKFIAARKRIREALSENGVAGEMDELVVQLLS